MVLDLVKFIAMVFTRRRNHRKQDKTNSSQGKSYDHWFPFKSLLTSHITCEKQLYALVKEKDTLQWYLCVKKKGCHNKSLTAKLPALITDSLLLKTGGGFCGESNVPRLNNALHIWREQKQNEIASQTIQLTKERKYNGKLTKLSCRQQGNTVLFSTVLKPPSETLGSFSPRSKDVKTLPASENISRSVRTRTWMQR